MVTDKTKKCVFIRDRGQCVISGTTKNLERTPHHCFAKSEYFGDDRNDAWNLVIIGLEPHRLITFPSNDEEVKRGKEYAKKCREIALKRYVGKYRSKLIKIMKARYGQKWKGQNNK